MKTTMREYGIWNNKWPKPTGHKTIIFDHPITVKSDEALRVDLETGATEVISMKELCCEPQHEAYMQLRSECQYCKE